jgi:hypothetical protein
MLDIISQHVFSNKRYIDMNDPDRDSIIYFINYYITHLIAGTPYLFLYYLDKLEDFYVKDRFKSKYLFLLSILQLTLKWTEDIYYSNRDIIYLFCKSYIYLDEFNKMERDIFAALDYNLYINEETYMEYSDSIIKKYTQTETDTTTNNNKDTDTDTTKDT